MDQAEHLAWAKNRALAELDAAGPAQALTSLASDLIKHPRLAGHTGIELGFQLLTAGHLRTAQDMREYIDGCR